MTIYAIEVFHLVHTCPANPEPHPVDTRRRIVHVTPGRDCLTPKTFDNGVTIRCGDYNAYDQQCANCRTIITITKVTTHDLGYQGPAHLAPVPAEESA
ncbi:hypothetical protein [Planosporangium mesophilum]|uniref:Uncharacterized protein n=1 Tax=Planosporangium mesophilum TaxID=689768 RepID=A0A8J3TD89_9ACTN|nr:hypothetical protein [Planosporangium mesophilum]NJC85154.1 hypothetical protein [Planosporangium mesophilum]GII24298.1 hypothetical protein Pme01_38950 [Planosporangium mesophilum]